jgi:hypothetical protein
MEAFLGHDRWTDLGGLPAVTTPGQDGGMDLDQVAAELYGGSPEDFTGLRKERATEARKAGDRELARQITALRRPTRSAWIVNLLTDQAPDDLAGLLDLGAALAQAQQQLSGPELRKLSGQRHAAIAALVRRGTQLAEVRGHTPSEATLREVSATLQAALSDPEVAEEVRQGRLAQAREYSGFGPEMMFAAPLGEDQQVAAEAPPEPAGTVDDQDQSDAEHERLIQQLNSSQAALDRIRNSLQRSRERAERAAETATRRTARLAELQDQLDRVRREADQANDELDQARSALAELQQAERAAESAVSESLSRLADS